MRRLTSPGEGTAGGGPTTATGDGTLHLGLHPGPGGTPHSGGEATHAGARGKAARAAGVASLQGEEVADVRATARLIVVEEDVTRNRRAAHCDACRTCGERCLAHLAGI